MLRIVSKLLGLILQAHQSRISTLSFKFMPLLWLNHSLSVEGGVTNRACASVLREVPRSSATWPLDDTFENGQTTSSSLSHSFTVPVLVSLSQSCFEPKTIRGDNIWPMGAPSEHNVVWLPLYNTTCHLVQSTRRTQRRAIKYIQHCSHVFVGKYVDQESVRQEKPLPLRDLC